MFRRKPISLATVCSGCFESLASNLEVMIRVSNLLSAFWHSSANYCPAPVFVMGVSAKDIARPSIYKPLDVESYDTRMLTLFPGTSDSDVKCRLTRTSQISPTKYAALSYCWSDPNTTTEIIVNDIATPVTINLAGNMCGCIVYKSGR